MARTICGKGKMGGIRTSELFLLWEMVNRMQVNTCHSIISKLIQLAEQKKGDIIVGGMVTYIVKKLGLGRRLIDLHVLEGNTSIDLDLCDNMFLVKPDHSKKTTFHLIVGKEKSIILPNPARKDTRNQENQLYLDAFGNIPQEVPVQEEGEEEMAEQEEQNENDFNIQAWCVRVEREQQRQIAELER